MAHARDASTRGLAALSAVRGRKRRLLLLRFKSEQNQAACKPGLPARRMQRYICAMRFAVYGLVGLLACAQPLAAAHAQTSQVVNAVSATEKTPTLPPRVPLAAARRMTHSVGADYGLFVYQSTGLPLSAGGAAVFYRARFDAGLAVSAGLRFLHVDRLPAGFGIEGFVSAQVAPQLGHWHPLVGIEVGGTSLSSDRLQPEPGYSPEEYQSKQGSLGPAYVGFVLAPLRFCVRRVTFAVAGLQLATHLPQLGRALRLQSMAAQLEWRF